MLFGNSKSPFYWWYNSDHDSDGSTGPLTQFSNFLDHPVPSPFIQWWLIGVFSLINHPKDSLGHWIMNFECLASLFCLVGLGRTNPAMAISSHDRLPRVSGRHISFSLAWLAVFLFAFCGYSKDTQCQLTISKSCPQISPWTKLGWWSLPFWDLSISHWRPLQIQCH